jgi:hypothetical protein
MVVHRGLVFTAVHTLALVLMLAAVFVRRPVVVVRLGGWWTRILGRLPRWVLGTPSRAGIYAARQPLIRVIGCSAGVLAYTAMGWSDISQDARWWTPLTLAASLLAALIAHEMGHSHMYWAHGHWVASVEFGIPFYGRTTAVGARPSPEDGQSIAMAGFGANLLLFVGFGATAAAGWRAGGLWALGQASVAASALFPSHDWRDVQRFSLVPAADRDTQRERL